jgi:hypothetical protein
MISLLRSSHNANLYDFVGMAATARSSDHLETRMQHGAGPILETFLFRKPNMPERLKSCISRPTPPKRRAAVGGMAGVERRIDGWLAERWFRTYVGVHSKNPRTEDQGLRSKRASPLMRRSDGYNEKCCATNEEAGGNLG